MNWFKIFILIYQAAIFSSCLYEAGKGTHTTELTRKGQLISSAVQVFLFMGILIWL